MSFGNNIKRLRKDLNMSQEQLAEKLNVSRQSVSKWESDISYPEMDKMLQLCKLFNVNIDELLNQDIVEVNDTKESKKNVNNFIDSMLSYITKTVDVFSCMKLKDKIKCLFEQLVIIFILTIIFTILGLILSSIFSNILNTLHIYNSLGNIFLSMYFLVALIIGIVILLHVFKIRYLDYYEIVSNFDTREYNVVVEENNDNNDDNNKKIVVQKREEKIIIRDEKDSKYKFINGLLKLFLIFVKIFVTFCLIGLIFSLVFEIILLVISFMFVKTGLLFVSVIISTLSIITVNIVFLILCYNFIISHKNKLKTLALITLSSIIIFGIGIGLFTIGLNDFEITNEVNLKYYKVKNINLDMSDDLIIHSYNIKYEEVNSDDIEILITYPKNNELSIYNDNNVYEIDHYDSGVFSFNKDIIEMINNKKIYNIFDYSVVIKTNKENIKKLKENDKKQEINLKQQQINDLRNKIYNLEDENSNLKNEIIDLKDKLNYYNSNSNSNNDTSSNISYE